MFRPLLIIVALLPVIGAQTLSTEPAPINVIGYVIWPITSGPELSMTVQNSSARGIQGYWYQVIFTDPETGKQVSKSESIGCYRWPGVELAAGSETHVVKPVPITARGIPANYSFNVDLVFLDDGTTWGPAKTNFARTFLAQIAAFAKVVEAQSK